MSWLAPAIFGAGQSLATGLTTGWGRSEGTGGTNFVPYGSTQQAQAANAAADAAARAAIEAEQRRQERKQLAEDFKTYAMYGGAALLGVGALAALYRFVTTPSRPAPRTRRWYTKRRTRR